MNRGRPLGFLAGALALVALGVPASALASTGAWDLASVRPNVPSPPAVTVTSPAPGSSSTVDDPTFAGAAGNGAGDGSQVTLRVYSGGTNLGTPVQTVTVQRFGAAWSATLASPLALGTYTAQAEQDNSMGDVGLSPPVTFAVTVPAITLSSPGSRPLTTSTPTLTGTADTDAGSAAFATVEIFGAANPAGSPPLSLRAPVARSGQFSVQVIPALADGTYTAVAQQGDAAGNTGVSAPQTFSIDTHPPAVTLVRPAIGTRADVLQLVFAGAAGGASFDSPVTVALYKGAKPVGSRVGTVQAKVTGSTWSTRWPGALAPGVYTALASQTDAVGHRGVSIARTFSVLPLPPIIGDAVTIDRAGRVTVKIACNEPPGDACSATVLVLTRAAFQPLAGGLVGRLTVMFAYVRIPGAQTSTISRTALASVAAALRHHANVPVTISATLHPQTGKTVRATARVDLRGTGK